MLDFFEARSELLLSDLRLPPLPVERPECELINTCWGRGRDDGNGVGDNRDGTDNAGGDAKNDADSGVKDDVGGLGCAEDNAGSGAKDDASGDASGGVNDDASGGVKDDAGGGVNDDAGGGVKEDASGDGNVDANAAGNGTIDKEVDRGNVGV